MSTTVNPRWNIGDAVWVPMSEYGKVWEQCPDCLGTCHWHVTLPSGEEFDCECCRCYPGGYEASTGKIGEKWTVTGKAVQTQVTSVAVRDGEAEYGTSVRSCLKESDIFADEASAFARSLVMGKEWADAEFERMHAHAIAKGRPRKNRETGRHEANDGAFGGGSINYAKSQVRRGIEEAFKWIEYARRKGCELSIDKFVNDARAPDPTPSPRKATT